VGTGTGATPNSPSMNRSTGDMNNGMNKGTRSGTGNGMNDMNNGAGGTMQKGQ
jgi:hypothetical protein